jgi:sugar phosphate isomerase/epimerase
MQIKPGLDLTYCTNIHAGESWDEVEQSIARYALPLRDRLAGGKPFAIGLRLSAIAAEQLLAGDRLPTFKAFLDSNRLYVAVINGFPYGSFHGGAVKSKVFAPDWRDPARARYTLNLAKILSQLLPRNMEGGISTMPLSYKPWLVNHAAEAWPAILDNLVEVVSALIAIRNTTGCMIHLDLEPEPNGLVENVAELIEFFDGAVGSEAVSMLAHRLGISHRKARQHWLDHVRVCFDTCHMAIEFEDPIDALNRLAARGIRIGRVQISSALRILFDGSEESRTQFVTQLAPFADHVYLHQVIERRADGALTRYADLDEALTAAHDGSPREWRIHFHMPIFTERYGTLLSTHEDNRRVLEAVMDRDITRHLEIETYTWDVLPAPLKSDLLSSIEREFKWVLNQMSAELCAKP